MMTSPVLIFYIVGLIFQVEMLYLLKLGLFMALYLSVYGVSLLLFDDRLMTVMPMAVYLATKVCCTLISLPISEGRYLRCP